MRGFVWVATRLDSSWNEIQIRCWFIYYELRCSWDSGFFKLDCSSFLCCFRRWSWLREIFRKLLKWKLIIARAFVPCLWRRFLRVFLGLLNNTRNLFCFNLFDLGIFNKLFWVRSNNVLDLIDLLIQCDICIEFVFLMDHELLFLLIVKFFFNLKLFGQWLSYNIQVEPEVQVIGFLVALLLEVHRSLNVFYASYVRFEHWY